MDYLPLGRRAWVHLTDTSIASASEAPVVQSGTLGATIRWMRQQPEADRARFAVGIQHQPGFLSYRELEVIAARTGSLG